MMQKLQQSSNISSETKKKLKQTVESSLKAGQLRTSAVKQDAIGVICELQSVLAAAGVDNEAIVELLASVSSKDLSPEELEKLLASILDGVELSDEDKSKLEAIKEKLKSGAAKSGLNSEVMEKLMLMKTVMEATGAGQDKVIDISKSKTNKSC